MHILIMILLISLLVLVHELGHFGVAKLFKFKVDRFGFGLPFGPVLWEKKIGDVTYCVHAFLLGGYVAFPDDDPDSSLPQDDPGRFKNKPLLQRALVISAGVTANALLAIIIILGVAFFTQGVPTNNHKIFIKELTKEIPNARLAGFKPGDRIVAVNDIKINSFMEFNKFLQANKSNNGYVSDVNCDNQLKNIINSNQILIKKLGYDINNNLNDIKTLVIPYFTIIKVPNAIPQPALVPDFNDPFSSPIVLPESAKLSPYELSLNKAIINHKFTGNGETTFGDLARITANGERILTISVERNNKIINLIVSPNNNGYIGFKPKIEDIYEPTTSISQTVQSSYNYLYKNTYFMVLGLYKIFTGQVDIKDLHGIVAITKVGGDIIKDKGMRDGWLLTALISIDLAIVNLLPIPALDGGHLLFLLIESLRGRPVEEKYQEAISKYGFLFLIGLMLLIVFNDIIGLFTSKF